MSDPTAGPWGLTSQGFVFSKSTGDCLAYIIRDLDNLNDDEAKAQALANGHLMAASKAMSEALMWIGKNEKLSSAAGAMLLDALAASQGGEVL